MISHISKFLASLILLGHVLAQVNLRQQLKSWEFVVLGMFGNEWRTANIPSNIHLDLLTHGLISDPFNQTADNNLTWLETAKVIYRSDFTLSAQMEGAPNQELVFDGIDTEADVYLNGQKILTATDTFMQYTVDVTIKLNRTNTLEVHFNPQMLNKEIEDLNKTKLRYNSSYHRKPAYQYGREMSPRLVTMGLWKSVWLVSYHNVKFDYVWVRTRNIMSKFDPVAKTSITQAVLSLAVVLKGDIYRAHPFLSLAISVNGIQDPVRPAFHYSYVLFHNITIQDAKLWWPRGVGEPYQYELVFRLWTPNDNILEQKKVMFGIRTIQVTQPESYFRLTVNQYNIYARGAVVLPRDSLYSRSTNPYFQPPYSLKAMMDDLEQTNINMVKVWGGGVYQSDQFYEECSKRGIMVFQQFMFSVGPFPQHIEFLERCQSQIKYQVRRLRNYPCMAIISGNNEVKLHSVSWGVDAMSWNNASETLFGRLIRVITTMEIPEVTYIESSPNQMNSMYSGEYNNMWIYQAAQTLQSYSASIGKFSTKFGMQSFPVWETIETFAPPHQRKYSSAAILSRQLLQNGFQNMQDYIESYMRMASSFEMEVYQSGIIHAELIKLAIATQRSNMEATSGSLYWHFNDMWPGITCSTVDYYGRWKPAQYAAKRYFKQVSAFFIAKQLMGQFKKQLFVIAVNDNLYIVNALIRVIIVSTEGDMLLNLSKNVAIPRMQTQNVFTITAQSIRNYHSYGKERVAFYVQIITDKDNVMSSTFYLVHHRQLAIPYAALNVSYSDQLNMITVSSDKLIKDLYIYLKGFKYIRISDNYFDVIPFVPVSVIVKDAKLSQIKDELEFTSYRQSFMKKEKLIVNIV